MRAFPTVHCHPQSLDSASSVEAFARREVELGSGTLTCTDHGSLAAAFEVVKWAKAEKWPDKTVKPKLTPIVGLEGYVRDDNCPILKHLGIPRTDFVPRGEDPGTWKARYPDGTFFEYAKYYHITLGFRDFAAYRCAVRLLSRADLRAEKHGSERKPLFTWGDLEELAQHNVTATSSCLIGMVQRHLLGGGSVGPAAATLYLRRLHHLFGDRFFIEVFPHDCSRNWVEKVIVKGTNAGGPTELRLNWEKWIRVVDSAGTVHDLQAEAFAARGEKVVGSRLVGIKDYSTWRDIDPVSVLTAVRVEDFVSNECSPAVPDGDVQAMGNRFVLEAAARYKIPVVIGDDCLAAGTLIRTSLGCKPIEKVMPGDLVVTHKGRYQPVEATRGFFSAKQFVTIEAGGVAVTLTEDHRVWAMIAERHSGEEKTYGINLGRQSTPRWVAAGELKPGDLVYVPKAPTSPECLEHHRFDLLGYINHRWRYREDGEYLEVDNRLKCGEPVRFKRFLELSTQDAWILGFFVGDGNAHNNLVSFVAETSTYNEVLRPRLLELTTRMEMSWDEIVKGTHSVFRIINTALAQFFRREFYQEKVKSIPQWVEHSSPIFKDVFVGGLLYADGSSFANGSGTRYSLSMTSLRAVSFVREHALSRGVYCSLGKRKTTGATMPLYTVNLPPEAGNIWPLWGDASHERSKARWLEDTGGFWIRTKSVQKAEPVMVYDLQVKEDESFCTSSFAVHNSHFATPDEKIVQDVRLSQGGSWRFATSYHRQSSEEAIAYFKARGLADDKTFESWVDNSLGWADGFKGFKLETKVNLPTKFFPKDTLGYTKKLIARHGRERNDPVYIARRDAEIEMLHRNGKHDLLPYFMVDEEICRIYRNQSELPGPGRGSAAGLYLAYLEGITHVDPIKYDLSKDRFMTPDRIKSGKLPDIDQDLPHRDWLEGFDCDCIEFEAADGTKHVVPEVMRFDTDLGPMTIREALEKGAELESWWTLGQDHADQSDNAKQ
jgi:hypothetical protein